MLVKRDRKKGRESAVFWFSDLVVAIFPAGRCLLVLGIYPSGRYLSCVLGDGYVSHVTIHNRPMPWDPRMRGANKSKCDIVVIDGALFLEKQNNLDFGWLNSSRYRSMAAGSDSLSCRYRRYCACSRCLLWLYCSCCRCNGRGNGCYCRYC